LPLLNEILLHFVYIHTSMCSTQLLLLVTVQSVKSLLIARTSVSSVSLHCCHKEYKGTIPNGQVRVSHLAWI
jgi:hypothetical protein